MPYTNKENYLERAINDGHLKFQGDGKTEKIVYVADNNHAERWSDPEERVRAEFYAELIYHYEYNPKRIGVEIIVPRRTPSDRADLVIYSDDERKDPYLVVECKRDGISDAEFLQAIEQGCGNRASLGTKFVGIVAGATRRFLDFRKAPAQERQKNVIADLPIRYGNPPEYRFHKNEPGKDLKAVPLKIFVPPFANAIKPCGKADGAAPSRLSASSPRSSLSKSEMKRTTIWKTASLTPFSVAPAKHRRN